MLTEQQKRTPVSGVGPMKRKEVEGKIIILVARNHALDSSCSGFLVDSKLTLTDSFTTDIALKGTALANGPFGSGSCDQWVVWINS